MANVVNIGKDRDQPLGSSSYADLEGKPVPEIDWLIPGVLVKGGVTLFSGQGGKGKSLLSLQLQAASALRVDWLGMPTQNYPIPSLGLYCEDEEGVLHKRMDDIRKHYGCTFTDLEPARFKSRVGLSNELMRFWGRKEQGELTPLFNQLAKEIELWGIKILIIDTVADTFGGNENIRSQVRTFVNALRRLVLPFGGGVILNAHPSRAGMLDGSGLSGSTAWEASVRARINLTEPKKQDDEDAADQEPTRERVLKVMKNNYGPAGQKWKLLWDKGVFIRQDMKAVSQLDRLEIKAKLAEVARKLVSRGAFLAAIHKTRTSLTAMASDDQLCKGYSFAALCAAQETLVADGALVIVELGPTSKRRRYIRPVELRYPGEVEK